MPPRAGLPISLLALAVAIRPAVAEDLPQHRDVLLLNSYHEGYRWTDLLTDEVKAALAEDPPARLFVEYMDAKRWTDPKHAERLRDGLLQKFASGDGHVRLEAVVAADDHALDFALANREEVFPGVPIVFCGINDFRPSRIAGHGRVAGVVEDYDFGGTLNVILSLHPGTKRFLVVGDETLSGREALARLAREEPRFADRATFEHLVGLPVRDLVARLSAAGGDTVVLYVSWLALPDGRVLDLEESRRLVASASPVPVWCFWDFIPGTGLVGGREMSAARQGATAAALVRRMLAGEDPDRIGVVENPRSPFVLDWARLSRFGVRASALPAGSIVLGRPVSFYERNAGWIWGLAAFLLLESLLVAHSLRSLARRRRLEEQLRQSQKMEAVGRLAGGIAHDFRNQLTVSRGYCDLVARGMGAGDPARHAIDRIREAVGRATRLPAELLAFSRKEMLEPVAIDLDPFLRRSIETIGRLIGERFEIALEVEPGLPPVLADPNQLEHALLNVAANARDAMPTGGRLVVSARRVPGGDSRVSHLLARADLPHVAIAVGDTGVGMTDEVRERVFEPFFTTKPVGQGTGLGLSMVYGFVRQSGGAVEVETAPGRGTTVRMLFPAGDAPADDDAASGGTAAARPARATPPGGSPGAAGSADASADGPATVLVVEDEPMLLELCRTVLERAGMRVHAAAYPDEALRLVGEGGLRPDVLVTDVVMPGIGGPELVERIRTLLPGLPVVMVSGYPADLLEDAVRSRSGVRLLPKPFSPDALVAAVSSYFVPPPSV